MTEPKLKPFKALEFIKTEEELEAYVQERIAGDKEDYKTVLIDYELGHKIAFQSAATFRPSYFGVGFRCHNWVVEAVRSAHIDGQLHAMGRPAVDRSASEGYQLLKRSK